MGILVGTSLIVIIPEGVDTLYSASANASGSQKAISSRSTHIGWQQPVIPVAATTSAVSPGSLDIPSLSASTPAIAPSEAAVQVTHDQRRSDGVKEALQTRRDEADSGQESHDSESSAHAWIGIALVSGFILMYLIDKLPEFATSSKHQRPPYHISLDNLGGSGLRRGSSPSRESGLLEPGSSPRRNHSFATTAGLVIHAAADGIALGASSSNAGLSFIIFLAIMVHKAPASFGLTSVLLKQGLSSRAVRAHLLVFSLAAPVGALATFLFVQLAGFGLVGDEIGTKWRTGVLLLFSGGTFL